MCCIFVYRKKQTNLGDRRPTEQKHIMSTITRELWMRENTTFTMSDGSEIEGYRIISVRNLEEGEDLDDIDGSVEFEEVVSGSGVPTNVDGNYEPIDDDEIVDEDIEMFNPTFYIGDEDGKVIEE